MHVAAWPPPQPSSASLAPSNVSRFIRPWQLALPLPKRGPPGPKTDVTPAAEASPAALHSNLHSAHKNGNKKTQHAAL